MARNCYVHALKTKETLSIEDLDQRDEVQQRRIQPSDEIAALSLDPNDTTRVTQVGIEARDRHPEILAFLQNNANGFTFAASDMPGIDPEIMTHRLNVNPEVKPVKQKKRLMAPE